MKLFVVLGVMFFYIGSAQSFQELKDSTNYYQKQRNFPTALEWAKKAYDYSQTNFERTDSNNLYVLKKIAALYFNNGVLDSAIKYQTIHLEIAEETLNEFDEEIYKSTNNLAVFYVNSGNLTEAEKYYIKTEEVVRQIYKDDHPHLTKTIQNLASFYLQTGKLDLAKPLLEETVEMNKRLYTEPHEQLGLSLSNLANFYLYTSDFDLAEKYYLESYEVYKQVFDENDDRLSLILNNLGAFYSSISKFNEAEVYLIKALELRRNIYKNAHPYLLLSINSLVALYLDLEKVDVAGPLAKEAVEMSQQMYKETNELNANSYRNYSIYNYYIGQYTESEEYIQKSIEFYEQNSNKYIRELSHAYNTFGKFYSERGMLKESLYSYHNAYEILEKMNLQNHAFAVTILNNIGHLYHLLDNNVYAIQYFKKALNVAEIVYDIESVDFLSIYISMGNYYTITGDFKKAEEYLDKTLEIHEAIYDEPNRYMIDIYIGIANLFDAKNDYNKSEEYYMKALNILEKYTPQDYLNEHIIKNNIVNLHINSGNIDKAEKSVLSLYKNFPKNYSKKSRLYLKLLNLMNRVNLNKSHDTAFKYINESLVLTYSIINDFFPVLSDYERNQFSKSFKENFYLTDKFVINNYESEPEYAGFLLNKQINTKGLLLSTSSIFKNELSESTDTVLVSTYNKWKDAKEYIARIYLKSNQELEQTGINLDSLTEYVNNLEKELAEKSKSFDKIKPVQEINYKDIQNMLGDNEAAVEIIKIAGVGIKDTVIDINYAALVLKKNSIYPELIVFDNGSELETSKLALYKKELMNDNDDKKSYGNYWGRIAERLNGIDKVYLSPDGVYNQINLNTLKNPETEKYLYEEITITALTNIREIIDLKDKNEIKQNTDFVFFGNPDFNYKFGVEGSDIFVQTTAYNMLDSITRGGLELYPLHHTVDEIQSITKIIEKNKYTYETYLDTSATEEMLKEIKKPRVLHLSTHGYFLKDVNNGNFSDSNIDMARFNENPLLRSMLFFTGSANALNDSLFNKSEDGILTALEAQNLDLRNTELAVLAACETGLGEIISGEGVYGLQRAFIQAGAENIIMSLWKANDKATKELMVNFYKEWFSGKSKQQAFKSAQNIVREKFRYPYFWGAFVMIGE